MGSVRLPPVSAYVQATRLDAATLHALHVSHPQRYPVLLESTAAGAALGQFSVLFALPCERLELQADGTLSGNAPIALTGTFLEALDRWWQTERLPATTTSLPFQGGWFLFLGYEPVAQIEPSLRLPAPTTGPIAVALRMPAAIVHSSSTGETWLVAEPGQETAILTMQEDLRAVAAVDAAPPKNSWAQLQESVAEDPPEQFLMAVDHALRHIAMGDIYQANLSQGWQATVAPGVQAHHVYSRLRQTNPGPFSGLAVLGSRAIICSSPERLVEVRGSRVSTRPIAGTRPRSSTLLADRRLACELRRHPKEQAEHVMLIDLERNDLGRVCEPGSVEVDEYMSLESYAHVHHIVSNVRGVLRSGVTPGQVIAAVFPGGTITGCPKVRCMQLIGDLERTPRAAYTGSMGYLNRDGSMDLNILIRTLEMTGRQLQMRAGAGIVADSIPERELEEARAKARGMLAALLPIEPSA